VFWYDDRFEDIHLHTRNLRMSDHMPLAIAEANLSTSESESIYNVDNSSVLASLPRSNNLTVSLFLGS
jgi:hypothetical protein